MIGLLDSNELYERKENSARGMLEREWKKGEERVRLERNVETERVLMTEIDAKEGNLLFEKFWSFAIRIYVKREGNLTEFLTILIA